jgi:hypothetical protein
MIGLQVFKDIPAPYDLNGPNLSFSRQPVGVATTDSKSVTLVGIATATFPVSAINDGTISYQWYEIGVGKLSDGTNISGSGTTTLSLSNLKTPADNQRKFYLQADYVPSTHTGNAFNEPLSSGIATVTVYPLIQITSQPTSKVSLINRPETFTIVPTLTDTTYYSNSQFQYQWQLNEVNLSDGTIQIVKPVTQVNQTYSSDSTVVLPSDATDIVITVAGASGGGGGSDANGPGGGGGSGRVGKFTLPNGGRTLNFKIGNIGNGGSSGNQGAYGTGGTSGVAAGARGGGAGPSGWSGGGGGGGGSTGVFDSVSSSYIIVAGGGGGGGGGSWNRGAEAGTASGDWNSSSGSFSVTAGSIGTDEGSDGGGGGGGGGGATGGSGGYQGYDNNYGGGGGYGGGSKYNSNVATYVTNSSNINSGTGYVTISFLTNTSIPGTIITAPKNITISGSKTSTLTLNADSVGIQTVRCLVYHPSATNSPVKSDNANLVVIPNDKYVINFENINTTNATSAILSSIDLANGEFTLNPSNSSSNTTLSGYNTLYSFYSPNKDIDVEMDLYAAAGSNSGTILGGQGGFSRIQFTMKQNEEYVIAGFPPSDTTGSIFLYRKSSLIASVGGGGNAGTKGAGGNGGGVNVAGGSGLGLGAGAGGAAIQAGKLTFGGVFGSLTTQNPTNSQDTKAAAPNGGRTIPCPRGNQKISPCTDLGTTQFLYLQTTTISNTASISRGFKQGYGIRQTAGLGLNGGGNGADGATGGNGGSGGGGGGAGGYTDGSITVVSTQQGGNTGFAKIIFRVNALSQTDYYVDSVGRILILSCATPGKDPRTLTQTVGKVLPGTDTCIDDAKWQNFLNLADAQDYRLTATLNNSSTSIVKASPYNIKKMKNANYIKLRTSLTDWQQVTYAYPLYCLAWDETNIGSGVGFGGDYSILAWSPNYTFGYYADSSNSFFTSTSYPNSTANWWILPPGVPDF